MHFYVDTSKNHESKKDGINDFQNYTANKSSIKVLSIKQEGRIQGKNRKRKKKWLIFRKHKIQ